MASAPPRRLRSTGAGNGQPPAGTVPAAKLRSQQEWPTPRAPGELPALVVVARPEAQHLVIRRKGAAHSILFALAAAEEALRLAGRG